VLSQYCTFALSEPHVARVESQAPWFHSVPELFTVCVVSAVEEESDCVSPALPPPPPPQAVNTLNTTRAVSTGITLSTMSPSIELKNATKRRLRILSGIQGYALNGGKALLLQENSEVQLVAGG